jgi:hypothetical protein
LNRYKLWKFLEEILPLIITLINYTKHNNNNSYNYNVHDVEEELNLIIGFSLKKRKRKRKGGKKMVYSL